MLQQNSDGFSLGDVPKLGASILAQYQRAWATRAKGHGDDPTAYFLVRSQHIHLRMPGCQVAPNSPLKIVGFDGRDFEGLRKPRHSSIALAALTEIETPVQRPMSGLPQVFQIRFGKICARARTVQSIEDRNNGYREEQQ